MAATATERDRIRRRTNGTESSMTSGYLDDIFNELEVEYSGYPRKVIYQAALVQVWSDIESSAVMDVDYTSGESSEKLSQRFKNIQQRRMAEERTLAQMEQDYLKAKGGLAMWGDLRKPPSRRDRPRG